MSAAESAEKNVLIFRTFAPVDFAGPLESALRVRAPWQINFYVESLDNGRLADEGYENTVAATLQHSYRGHKLDLVIAEWSPALRFAVRHRDELFPGVPIVFVGVDTSLFVGQKLWSGVTGVTVTTDVSRTINLALHLHPDTNTVAIIIGNTDFERYWLGKVHSELARHQVKEVDFIGLPTAQLLRGLAALPPRTVVLFEEEPQDSIQPAMGPYDILAWTGQRLPTYCIFGDECVNHGGIGGDFMDVGQQLSLNAEIATRVLAGERRRTSR